MKRLVATLISIPFIAYSGITADKIPGFKLQLAEETYLSDRNGVLSADQISRVELGRLVRIYRTDGFYYTGKVTAIEESDSTYKVYGDVNNVKNTHFGFVLAKGGVFAGAVVEIDNKQTYVVELSEVHKGFVLQLTTKYDKSIL
jgi:hypothetical protein